MSVASNEIGLPYPVRESRQWTLEKLAFLKKYLSAYVKATQRIKVADVCYMDLCAGPGRDLIQETGEIIDGSPLIAMKLFPRFRRFIFGDLESNFMNQLEIEAASLGTDAVTHTITGDANIVVDHALSYAPEDGATFCFIDPPGIDIHWKTIERVSHYKPPERLKPELFILFAYDMDLVRFLTLEGNPEDIWGEDSFKRIDLAMPDSHNWRTVYDTRKAGRIHPIEARRRFAYIYWKGLRKLGYKYVLNPKLLRRTTGHPLYFLFFASDHPVGEKIMNDVLHKPDKIEGPVQLRLDFPDDLWVLDDPWDFKEEGENWYRP